jgi:hypothetical protein
MSNERLQYLVRFYSILNELERRLGGARTLSDCKGRMNWLARISSAKLVKAAPTQVQGLASCASAPMR